MISSRFFVFRALVAFAALVTAQFSHPFDNSEEFAYLVRDLQPGADSSVVDTIVDFNGKAVLVGNFGNGRELWLSDGNKSNTIQLSNSDPDPKQLTVGGNKVYFSGEISSGIRELMATDGTANSSYVVRDLNTTKSGNPGEMMWLGGKMYFVVTAGGDGRELWKTDGTNAGTTQVLDLNAGNAGSDPYGLTMDGAGTLYFAADNGVHGRELWRLLGGDFPYLLSDLMPYGGHGVASASEKGWICGTNGEVFFVGRHAANGVDTGWRLWNVKNTDSTVAYPGNLIPADPNNGAPLNPREIVAPVNGVVWFSADSATKGREIWTATRGLSRMFNLRYEGDSSNPEQLTVAGGRLFFSANRGTDGGENILFYTDGNPPQPPNGSSLLKNPRSMVACRRNGVDYLYCVASGENGTGIYRVKVSNNEVKFVPYREDLGANIFSGSANPVLTKVGDTVYFYGKTIESLGSELFSITTDNGRPKADWIKPLDTTPTNANTVRFQVRMSENSWGVDASDFSLITSGTSGSIDTVTGAEGTNLYTVSIKNVGGDGTMILRFKSTATIWDRYNNNVNTVTEDVAYTIDNTVPQALNITRRDTSPTSSPSVQYLVTFSEAVSGVSSGDFSVVTTGPISGAGIVSVAPGANASERIVNVNTGTGDGFLKIELNDTGDNIVDTANQRISNPTGLISEPYEIDKTPPEVRSILRVGAESTNAAVAYFTIEFSEAVTGVPNETIQFEQQGDLNSVRALSVEGSGATWTLKVDTGAGSGTLTPTLVDTNEILDSASNRLGGPAVNDGSFRGTESFRVDRNVPIVSSSQRIDSNPTRQGQVSFRVTFSEPVVGVGQDDFSASAGGGVNNVSIDSVSGSDSIYTVVLSTGTGSGTLRLLVENDGSIQDVVGNPLAAAFVAGESYTLDRARPTVTSVVRGGTTPTNQDVVSFYVNFSEAVVGVEASAFRPTYPEGTPGIAVTEVLGNHALYEVKVSTGESESGYELGLDVGIEGSIRDTVGNQFNVAFTESETYTVDKSAPLASIAAPTVSVVRAGPVDFLIHYSNAVAVTLTEDDVELITEGTATASLAVTGSGIDERIITLSNIRGDGRLALRLKAGTAEDALGNSIGAVGPSAWVDVDNTFIVPPGEALSTPENVILSVDLLRLEEQNDPIGGFLSWDIVPAESELYTASINNDAKILTIAPKANKSGVLNNVTLSLHASDNTTDHLENLTISVLHKRPTTPTAVVLPLEPFTTDKLLCTVQTPAAVGALRSTFYTYTWRKVGGSDIIHGPSTSLVDFLSEEETSPGESWTCTVKAQDQFDLVDIVPGSNHISEPFVVSIPDIRDKIQTGIVLDLSPKQITLGQSIAISGTLAESMEPHAAVPAALISFSNTSGPQVDIGALPEPIRTQVDGSFRRFFEPNQAGSWIIDSEWDGDNTHHGSDKAAVLTVGKAQPRLSATLSKEVALLHLEDAPDFKVEVQLSVSQFPAGLLHVLAGQTINLAVQRPDGTTQGTSASALTDSNGIGRFSQADLVSAFGMDQAGAWRFKAEFAGSDNLLPVSTADFDDTETRLILTQGSGYAIIVLGRLDQGAEGHSEHGQTTDFVYKTFIDRGFDPSDIHYLRAHLPGEVPLEGVTSLPATETQLVSSITEWARGKMLASPAPLYIVLIDHGTPGRFHIDDPATPGVEEALTPQELSTSISLLESSLTQANIVRAGSEIVVINGSCYSGGFVPALSGPNRVVIASAKADQVSYRGLNSDPNTPNSPREGEFFIAQFFRLLGEGRTLKRAFEGGSRATTEYTATSSEGIGAAERVQQPLLDDNGDGVGTEGELVASGTGDGLRAAEMTLGLSSNAGNSISWFTAIRSLTTGGAKQLDVPLYAETTGRAFAEGDTAWLEVKRPDYQDGLADATRSDLQRVATMAGPLLATSVEALGDTKSRLIWDASAVNELLSFDVAGVYRVYFFLRDGQTGQVATYLVSNIYVGKEDNTAPAPVQLLLPQDTRVIETSGSVAHFVWEDTVDAEGDSFTYTFELSNDPNFDAASTAVVSGLTARYLIYDRAFRVQHGIAEPSDGTYYWQVYAVDAYGAASTVHEVRRFTLRNAANPALPGGVLGVVADSETGEPVPGATIRLEDSSVTSGNQGGFAFLQLDGGKRYVLSAAAAGFKDAVPIGLNLAAGEVKVMVVELAPLQSSGGSVEIPDTIAPHILINSDTPADNTVDCGSGPYEDPLAIAVDTRDGVVTVTAVGVVNTSLPGSYQIAYTASDNAGNTAVAIRTVTVRGNCPIVDTADTTRPVISITDNNAAANTIDCGSGVYEDPGATATDDRTGTVPITTVGTVSGAIPGTFTLVYTARDLAGNEATPVVRTVTVRNNCAITPIDTTAPVITITDDTEEINRIGCGQGDFDDPGATAVDDTNGPVATAVIGSVNANVPGDYILLYTAVDEAGNQAIPVQRLVTVRDDCTVDDHTAPTIILNENTELANTVDCGVEAYIDPGAVAEDDRDGEVEVHTIGFVNTSLPGTYSLVYTAHDSATNEASVAIRMVLVLDNCTSAADVLSGLATTLLDDFDTADIDRDDTLSYDEAFAMMPTLTQAQFELLDTDNSGGLSSAELRAAVVAGEGEGEGETGGGCSQRTSKVREQIGDYLGEFLLFGIALTTLMSFRRRVGY